MHLYVKPDCRIIFKMQCSCPLELLSRHAVKSVMEFMALGLPHVLRLQLEKQGHALSNHLLQKNHFWGSNVMSRNGLALS